MRDISEHTARILTEAVRPEQNRVGNILFNNVLSAVTALASYPNLVRMYEMMLPIRSFEGMQLEREQILQTGREFNFDRNNMQIVTGVLGGMYRTSNEAIRRDILKDYEAAQPSDYRIFGEVNIDTFLLRIEPEILALIGKGAHGTE
jgi:hypothetical protein